MLAILREMNFAELAVTILFGLCMAMLILMVVMAMMGKLPDQKERKHLYCNRASVCITPAPTEAR